MTELLQIRSMETADVLAVSEIENACFPYPWGKQAFFDCLKVHMQGWVIVINTLIVGYAIVMTVLDESQLLSFAITPAYRGQQLASTLLQYIITQLQATGTKEMFLEVRTSNQPAIHLYEKLGFTRMGIRKAYYPTENGREDALVFRKEL